MRGFHAMAYLGPWARLGRGWDGFENSRRSARHTKGPGPWAKAHVPVTRVLVPAPGPWACAQGPGPWARALVLCPGSWALAQGPKSEKCKMAKSTSEEKMQPRTFRMARIDPSRQGVMNERSFVHGDLYFCPKNAEKVQKRLQTTKNPIPPSIHPYFFL